MPEKKMQQVFTDALIAEAYIMEHTTQQDSQKKLATKYYSEIFDKYHITKSDYFRSYDFYAHHPALFETTMGPIIDSLSAMEARLPTKPQSITIPSNTQPLPPTLIHLANGKVVPVLPPPKAAMPRPK